MTVLAGVPQRSLRPPKSRGTRRDCRPRRQESELPLALEPGQHGVSSPRSLVPGSTPVHDRPFFVLFSNPERVPALPLGKETVLTYNQPPP